MKNLRERWHGLTVLGVVAFAAACMTVAPAPSFADIAGGGGGGGPITEWCSDGRPKTGLVRCEDGNLRYFDPETGAMVTNQWHNEYEAVWYYFGADGIAVSGWQSIGGDKYYFYPESHDMAYGRVQIDGKNYFLNTPGANADGRMQHSGWLYDSIYGKWFYATSSGELLTGWHNYRWNLVLFRRVWCHADRLDQRFGDVVLRQRFRCDGHWLAQHRRYVVLPRRLGRHGR